MAHPLELEGASWKEGGASGDAATVHDEIADNPKRQVHDDDPQEDNDIEPRSDPTQSRLPYSARSHVPNSCSARETSHNCAQGKEQSLAWVGINECAHYLNYRHDRESGRYAKPTESSEATRFKS